MYLLLYFSFGLVIALFPVISCDSFNHVFQGCFYDTEAFKYIYRHTAPDFGKQPWISWVNHSQEARVLVK